MQSQPIRVFWVEQTDALFFGAAFADADWRDHGFYVKDFDQLC